MSWKSIKSVMIVILLGVNLWLVYLLVGRYMAQTYFSPDVLQNTVEILARDGIHMRAEQIDAKKRDADIYEAVMAADYYDSVAAIFTESPIHETFPTPTGVRMIADNGDTLSFSGSFGVNFLAGEQVWEELSSIAAWTVRAGEPIDPGHRSMRGLREALEARLDTDTAVGSGVTVHAKLVLDAAYRFGAYTLFRCSQALDGKPISGHSVDCLFDESGRLLWLDGTWGFLSLTRNYSAPLYDQINILFMEKAACLEQREADAAHAAEPLTLASMQSCYILNTAPDPTDGGSRVYYSPAWAIAYTDGTTRIYSAVTGEAAGKE